MTTFEVSVVLFLAIIVIVQLISVIRQWRKQDEMFACLKQIRQMEQNRKKEKQDAGFES